MSDAGSAACMDWVHPLEFTPVMKLADNVTDAMRLMQEVDAICERLPKLDCGACGAPTCRALAEDVAKGLARDTDCIFLMRQEIQRIANQLSTLRDDDDSK